MKLLKVWIKWLSILAGILLLMFLLIFTTVDRTAYKEMSYYNSMMDEINAFHSDSSLKKGDTLRASWHKVALTPHSLPYPLAGYGLRKDAESVRDTTYVRTFLFDNGKTRIAYICLDLLVFPPELKNRLRDNIEKKYNLKLYLSATHTHSAPGGWEPKIAGRFLAGKYNEEYVNLLFNAVEQSISACTKKISLVEYAYVKEDAPEAVRNRLKGAGAPIDPYIRGIRFRNRSGEEAFLFTYAAHANCINPGVTYISADYPGELSSRLEKSGWADFVSYSAGAVGSHAPAFSEMENGIVQTDSISSILFRKISSVNSVYRYTNTLFYHRFPLFLREPHLRINKYLRIRPWVFYFLLGKDAPDIQVIELGDVILFGMPCDYSGELMPPLEELCEQNGKHFILSGFNGGYIGYITDDACYDWNNGETMDMNWHGPYNAAYFTELNKAILKKVIQNQ